MAEHSDLIVNVLLRKLIMLKKKRKIKNSTKIAKNLFSVRTTH
jgi:hypothetical protein